MRTSRAARSLSGNYRIQVAKHAGITFTATVRHLCCAIRKLAAVATEISTCQPLYRTVRGELPRTFWVPDDHGMVAAVETGFMSTSKRPSVSIGYMTGNSNVLWQLKTRTETNTGFHMGADISMLSQFSEEKEILFPPCTMVRTPRSIFSSQAVLEALC